LAQLSSAASFRHVHKSSPYWAQELSQSDTQASPAAATDDFFETEDKSKKSLTEEEILRKRNKSRLSPPHFLKINGDNPTPVPELWFHHTIKYKRKLYAKYGEKTGINPGIQWATHAELNKRLEYEGVVYPFTIQEMVGNVKEKNRLQQEYIERR